MGQHRPHGGAGEEAGVNYTGGTVAAAGNGAMRATRSLTDRYPVRYYKYNDTTWTEYPPIITGNQITITDNGAGDANPTVGFITDPGGPGVPGGADWGLRLLGLQRLGPSSDQPTVLPQGGIQLANQRQQAG